MQNSVIEKSDFSGYATKAGLKCSDGRTIMPDAFKNQDKIQVPLVWQHGHKDIENVLGHAILENRPDGVYTYGFFNNSPKAAHAKELLKHKDINALSIWANELIQRAGKVFHGAIREVSLVLSGANPGALIENVTISHGDDMDELLEDEAIIYTGLELEHSAYGVSEDNGDTMDDKTEGNVQDVLDTLTPKQTEVVQHMISAALTSGTTLTHAAASADPTVQEVYDSMTDVQKEVLHYMLGEALDAADQAMSQSSMNTEDDNTAGHGATNTEGNTMTRNVFEQKSANAPVLSHSDIEGIVADATKGGSLRDSVEAYALAHGIENIDVLFPEAQNITNVPEFLARRNEWVNALLSKTRKSPFTRIKTISADITLDDARAKGYVKGTMKKEEFFGVTKRVTIPTTIYKKQKLDRDDMVDITDFDVVTWLKGEMRIMLDEELARAVLMGDGRDISHEDKINEGNIRPIATDHELYNTTVYVNINDANSDANEIIDAIIKNRRYLRGTGQPTMFCSENYISLFLLLRDTTGRRIYRSLEELTAELRVAEIVPVEVMEEDESLIAVLVNPVDYVLGADKGGNVSMFDDFDIDYNQYKYLIETRVSGALIKLKAAMTLRKVAGTDVLATPVAPTFDPETGALTITNTTGVVYKHGATVVNALGSPYTVPPAGTWVIDATPAAGYYFESSNNDQWTFTADA